MSEHMTQVYEVIADVVRQAQRDLGRGVMPKEVVARLPYRRSEGSVRRDMAGMAKVGYLARVGGEHCRKGYKYLQ